jgi:hypothetical protein
MAIPHPAPGPSERVTDRLAVARYQRFVGRTAEIDLFRQALLSPQPPFAVLHVHGPGGIGKSALLREYGRVAGELGLPTIWLDGRDLDPSPSDFLYALGQALGLEQDASPQAALAAQPHGVLFVDTYETLASLDAWMRETLVPQLPSGFLVVLAGRDPLGTGWRADPGWQELVRVVSLRNLSPDESRLYLDKLGIPDTQHPGVLAFTHGHPLALALVTDMLAREGGRESFLPEHAPDVMQALLERFVHQIPSERHRAALEVCAHTRVTTEALLAETIGEEHASELFAWLRTLSFVEQGPQGVFPHDVAREVLDADLRWRNPEDYRELHSRVRRHVVRTLQETSGREQQRAAFDLLYLHRGNPIIRPIHDWDALTAGYAEPAAPADLPDILSLVHRHEGAASAEIAAYWAERQLGSFTICRGAGGEVIGFVAALLLRQATPEDLVTDPAIAAAWDFASRHGPVRPGEELIYHRFQMGRDTYQAVSPAMNVMAMTCALHWVTNHRLAWSFLAVAEPDIWHPVFTYLNLQRSPEAGFAVDARSYTVYTHDWRRESAPVWLNVMSKREMATGLEIPAGEASRPAPLVVLSEPEFIAAARQALRDYTRPGALAKNPLLRSRLTVDQATGEPTPAVLQSLIREAAAQLRGNPRTEKLYRAIRHTYLEPAATQELAAELLGLPFSSYRRHLTAGVEYITRWLWQRELHGSHG